MLPGSMRHGVSHIRLGVQGGRTKEHHQILLVCQQDMWVVFESDGMAGRMYMGSGPPGFRRRNKFGAWYWLLEPSSRAYACVHVLCMY